MTAAQDDDVRLQGFIRGVGLVTIFPRLTDHEMLMRQARLWSLQQIRAWRRWTDIGMNSYLVFVVALMGLVVWIVTNTDQEWPAIAVTMAYFLPALADWYRARRGWL